MPIQGFKNYLNHQLGKQALIATPVAATRRWPFRGPIVVNPNWEDADVDSGTLDPLLAPYLTGTDVTCSQSGPLAYNDAHVVMAASLMGGVSSTGSGPAKTWVFATSSTAVDAFEYYTDEWGDDVTADYVQAYGGIVEEVTFTYPDNVGPVTVDMNWRYAGANTGTIGSVPTAGLSVGSNPAWVYGADTEFYIDSTAGNIGNTKLTDTFHGGNIHITTGIDLKRYANGSNSRFAIQGYGRADRTITAEFRFAKQTASIAEVANLLNATAVTRFVELKTTSPEIITGTTPYSLSLRLAGQWRARTDDQIGGNDIIVLSMTARYNTTLAYPFRAKVINASASL